MGAKDKYDKFLNSFYWNSRFHFELFEKLYHWLILLCKSSYGNDTFHDSATPDQTTGSCNRSHWSRRPTDSAEQLGSPQGRRLERYVEALWEKEGY